MPRIDAATKRWCRSTADEIAIRNGCRLQERRAARVADFFRKFLRHSKGQWAGKPVELLEWQWTDLIGPLFGWVRPEGTRRFRRAYVEIPKKNGKSTIAAAIGLYMLAGDGEAGPEIYSAATDRAQASVVHGEAINMVDASPELSSVLDVNRSTFNIAYPKKLGFYRALSAEGAKKASNKEGFNAHCIIADELHVWRGRTMWEALKYAFAARLQGLLFAITTAGDDTLTVCYEQHCYAEQVLRGDVPDDRFFGYIRAAGPKDDWTHPKTWHKANPSLGVTIQVDDFRADCLEAQKTPTAQASFKRYRLDIWGQSSNEWLTYDQWQACYVDASADDLAGMKCYAGLDAAKTRDMSALVLVFPLGDGRFALLPFFWLPEEVVNDPGKPEEYRVWAAQGLLETTPGNVTDYAFIRRRFAELSKIYLIVELAFDPYNLEHLTQEIVEDTGVERIEFKQSIMEFTEPMRAFERLVLTQKLLHNGHPVLTWHVLNTRARSDANDNIRPVKPDQGDPKKIDGCVAGIMGVARALPHDGDDNDDDAPPMFTIAL